jgi:hypothetical protein
MLRTLLVLALAWKNTGDNLDSVMAARYVTFTKYYCVMVFHGVTRYIRTYYTKCHKFIAANSITLRGVVSPHVSRFRRVTL